MHFKFRLQSPWCKAVLLAFLLSGVALNGIAWMQARSMTHYVEDGERTAKPEELSFKISQGVVLLFPPYGASKQALLAPSKVFHELGYDALLVDFRGVGGSSGSDTTLGMREAKDVAQAVGYVQQKWAGRPIFLYGASMGSVAAMRAIAQEGVAPTAVILESPFDRLLNTVRHRFTAMGIPSFPGAELIVWWGGWQQGINGFAHNPVEYARDIKCPVLLMYGEYDKRVSLEEVKSILDALPDRKQLAVFSAVGHGSLASDDPQKWKQQVQQFLRQ